MQEIEVKLGFDPANTEVVRQSLIELFGRPLQQKNLQNTYFDTPAMDLRKLGWSLRLRDKEDGFEQTVKGRGSVQSGLHQRFEINQPLDHASLDIAKLSEIHDIQPFLPQIKPVFSTNFSRLSWDIEANGSSVELALDCGAITAPDAITAPEADGSHSLVRSISEIEVELKSGATTDVLTLAEKIAAKVPCWLYSDSKAKRGYELIDTEKKPTVSNEVCASLSDWVSLAGSYAQRLTADEVTDRDCADQLQDLISQLEKLIAVYPAERNAVSDTAERLISAFKSASVNQPDSVSAAIIRRLVSSSTYLGTLGVLVLSAEQL